MRLFSNAMTMGAAALAAAVAAAVVVTGATADDQGVRSAPAATATAEAVFAGGCFWCVEADFDKVDGVIETISGYTGGALENPTYEQVSYEETGHYEAVKVVYDPGAVTYEELVDYFWRHVDPTDAGGQFCDRGSSYLTAIFVSDEDERAIAEASKAEIDATGLLPGPIVTPILDASTFWPAEGYHQDYYQRNSLRYRYYRLACGRDARIEAVWSAADGAEG